MLQHVRKYFKNLLFSDRVDERLKAQIDLGLGVFVFFSFGTIYAKQLDLHSYFGQIEMKGDNSIEVFFNIIYYLWSGCLGLIYNKPLLLCMAVITFLWYWSYKDAVKTEMDILTSLFSNERKPVDYDKVLGKRWLPFISLAIVACFLVMAASISNVQRYIAIMLLLGILDMRGNTILRDNLSRYLFDEKFNPTGDDAEKISERRKVAVNYWIYQPHCERIGIYMIIAISASMADNSKNAFELGLWPSTPYILIMITIIANETIIHVWRYHRDEALRRIDESMAEETEKII